MCLRLKLWTNCIHFIFLFSLSAVIVLYISQHSLYFPHAPFSLFHPSFVHTMSYLLQTLMFSFLFPFLHVFLSHVSRLSLSMKLIFFPAFCLEYESFIWMFVGCLLNGCCYTFHFFGNDCVRINLEESLFFFMENHNFLRCYAICLLIVAFVPAVSFSVHA